jgi:HSP20 family protein
MSADPLERLHNYIQSTLGNTIKSLKELDDNFERGLDKDFWKSWSPAVDIVHSKDKVVVTADLPGLSKEDVNLELREHFLNISGNRPCPNRDVEDAAAYHWERGCGPFRRSVVLPRNASFEDIQASFNQGVLQVTIPTVPEKEQKKIPIQ